VISYDKDFYSWTQEQAELLRNGRFSELDIDNLIEEVESMGRSEKRELESRLTILTNPWFFGLALNKPERTFLSPFIL
jgi:hypothetical protein